MGYKILFDPIADHACDLPPINNVVLDTIAQCDECGQAWRAVDSKTEDGAVWFAITNVDARRRLERIRKEIPSPGEEKRKVLKPVSDEEATPKSRRKKS